MGYPDCSPLHAQALVLVLTLLLVTGGEVLSSRFLLILGLYRLLFSQLPNTVGWTRETPNAIRDLTTTDQGYHNGGADNEGENESVDTVPLWSPATLRCTGVGVVEEVEDQELRDESVLDWQENGRPGERSRDDTNGVSRVTLFTAVLGPFETPVNGSKEGDDLGEMLEGMLLLWGRDGLRMLMLTVAP